MKQNKAQEGKRWINHQSQLRKHRHCAGGQGAESQHLFSGVVDPRLTDIEAGGGQNHNTVSFATQATSCNNKQAT